MSGRDLDPGRVASLIADAWSNIRRADAFA